jgi:2-iminobutanoate/2-iminopropanoate deaminase
MSMRERIKSDDAPSFEENGLPISQAIVHKNTVYVAGQVGKDPDTGDTVNGGVPAQTEQALANAEAILEAAGSSAENIVKATVLIEDIDEFSAVNKVYTDFFDEPYPARTAFEVGSLAADYEVEIEVIGALED